jgi:sulfate permease, SulP family
LAATDATSETAPRKGARNARSVSEPVGALAWLRALPGRTSGLASEVGAGLTVGCITVSTALAAGSLAFAPIGAAGVELGARAGLIGAVVGGLVAVLLAPSSFVVSAPRASIAVVVASIVGGLLADPVAGGDGRLVVGAILATTLATGLIQMALARLGAARIVQFTPYPVLAGYVNGIALLLLSIQLLWVHAHLSTGPSALALPLFIAAIVATAIALRRLAPRVPGHFVALVGGAAAYHALAYTAPSLDLGPTFGGLPDLAAVTLFSAAPELLEHAAALGWHIAAGAALLAVVATLEALIGLRVAQSLNAMPIAKSRDLLSQGAANVAGALAGGLPLTVTTTQTGANFRSGGRGRLSVLVSIGLAAAVLAAGDRLLGLIPQSVLVALLTATALQTFDLRAMQLVRGALAAAGGNWRAPVHAGVIVAVMGVVATGQLALGALLGSALSAMIFIAEMSRPVIRRVIAADRVFSKRKRPIAHVDALRREGHRTAIVELRGVLFFGNADELMNRVRKLAKRHETLILDFRDIRHIDISGAAILGTMLERCARRGVMVLLCGMRVTLQPIVAQATRAAPAHAHPDLDSALEQIEDRLLARLGLAQAAGGVLRLDEVEATRGLDPAAIASLERFVEMRRYAAGEVLCREGDSADTMWILARGSVSVRLARGNAETRRVAGLSVGTTVGEMALLEGGRRSATIVADEDVECFAITATALQALVERHPAIALRLLVNLGAELSKRLRMTSDALRDARG